MIILGIETSCDDTCIAIVNSKSQITNTEQKGIKFEILANIVSSQAEIHRKYGGVYPALAKREHQKNLPKVLNRALKKAQLLEVQPPKIDAIAVTVGPGLEPCLWQGVNFAKELAISWNLPIIPVNHIEAHILANFLPKVSSKSQTPSTRSQAPEKVSISHDRAKLYPFYIPKIGFPAICLVVSGGHTQLILMKKIGRYEILGETRDDAAGECFDKTARVLGLGYPGGPAIAQQAEQWKSQILSTKSQTNSKLQCSKSKPEIKLKTYRELFSVSLPRPMMYSKDYDFSFSGLKTAVLYDFKKRSSKIKKSKKYIQAMCAEIQQAIIDVLIKKTIKAAKDYRVETIILGGGVVANNELRKQFIYKLKTINHKPNFLVPPKSLCTDNAAMIALTGYYHLQEKTKNWKKIKADGNLRIA